MVTKQNDCIVRAMCFLLLFCWIGMNCAEIITAPTEEQKQNKSISCSNDSECKVYCKEDGACRDTVIRCPVNQRCLVSCGKGSYACHGATIDARNSTLFALNDCYSGDDTSCSDMTIFFPPNLNGAKRAYLSTGDNFKTNLTFYAIYGFLDIDTSGYIGRRSAIDGIMYCMDGYSAHCDIASESWSCQNLEDPCNDPWALRTSTTTATGISSGVSDADSFSSLSTQQETSNSILTSLGTIGAIWYAVYSFIIVVSCCLCCIMYCYYRNIMGSLQHRDKLSQTMGMGISVIPRHRYAHPPITQHNCSEGSIPSVHHPQLSALGPHSIQIPIHSKHKHIGKHRDLKSIIEERPRTEVKTLSPSNRSGAYLDGNGFNFGSIPVIKKNNKKTGSLKPRFLEQIRMLSPKSRPKPRATLTNSNSHLGKKAITIPVIHKNHRTHNVPDRKLQKTERVDIDHHSDRTHLPVPPPRMALGVPLHTGSSGSKSDISSRSMTYMTASSIEPARTNTSTNSSSNFDSWTSNESLFLQCADTDMEETIGEEDYFITSEPDECMTFKSI